MVAVFRGCATIRVTDPPRTATEIFLQTVATDEAISQLSFDALRDRKVYLQTAYLTATTQPSDLHESLTADVKVPSDINLYLVGDLRAKLLLAGVRLVKREQDADIIMEVRSQGVSNERIEFLLGLPATSVSGLFSGSPLAGTTPQLAIVKNTKQLGFASVAYIAYWRDTGEVVAASGPFVGRTIRSDTWFFGYGPRTTGNIPPAEAAPVQNNAPTSSPKKKK